MNDLSFEGENRFDKYTGPLDKLLAMWMEGAGLDEPVVRAFPFKVKAPKIAPDLVRGIIADYAAMREAAKAPPAAKKRRVLFLGSRPYPDQAGQGASILWRYRLEEQRLRCRSGEEAAKITALLEAASGAEGSDETEFWAAFSALTGKRAASLWRALRGMGLAEF
jgi:hypothetical protein